MTFKKIAILLAVSTVAGIIAGEFLKAKYGTPGGMAGTK